MRRCAFLCVLAAGVAIAAEKKEEKKPESTDGTWVVVSVEVGGAKLPDTPGTVTIKGDKWTAKIGDEISAGTTKVDLTKKPAEIDLTFTDGGPKGVTMKGIMEIKGDTMRACYDGTGNERPKEFSTKDKPTYMIIEYKRAKK